jgi:hypothetical protein
MKRTFAKLTLYVYNKYIQEDWDTYTKWGKRFIYPFWVIRCIYVAVAFPVLALGYYWENSKIYSMVQDNRIETMVMMEQMMNDFNKK